MLSPPFVPMVKITTYNLSLYDEYLKIATKTHKKTAENAT
jgi:hypothetical protein